MRMKHIILMAVALYASINCQGQNDNYQLQVENHSTYDPDFMKSYMETQVRLTQGHQQASNQVWDNLLKVNTLIKQGDFDNADLLIDHSIQLNAQWQYHLIDHNTLLNKKQEIASARRNGSSQNNYSGYNSNSNYNSNSSNDDSYVLFKKAFNSYVTSAYNDYENGYYQSARQSLNDAYRIYEQQKLSLTQSESDRYNKLNELLKAKEMSNSKINKTLDLYELMTIHSNGTKGIPNFLARYGYQYGFTNEQNTVFYYCGEDGVDGTLAFDEKYMVYSFPVSEKSKVLSELKSFADYAKNVTDSRGESEVYVCGRYCFFMELKPSTIRNMHFYVISIYKVNSNDNSTNTDSGQSVSTSSSESDTLYVKAFKSLVQIAFNAYNDGNYEPSRHYLIEAYRVFDLRKRLLSKDDFMRFCSSVEDDLELYLQITKKLQEKGY